MREIQEKLGQREINNDKFCRLLLFSVDFYSGGRVSHIKAGVNALGIFWSKIIKSSSIIINYIEIQLVSTKTKYPKCAEPALVC